MLGLQTTSSKQNKKGGKKEVSKSFKFRTAGPEEVKPLVQHARSYKVQDLPRIC